MKFLGNFEFNNKNNKPKSLNVQVFFKNGQLKKHIKKTYYDSHN